MKSFLKGKWGKSLTKYKKFIKKDFFAMHNKWGLRKVSFETKSGNEIKFKEKGQGKRRAWEINDMQESKTKATIIEDVFCSDRHLKVLN